MVFNETFFEEEERDGFVVSSTMKRVWASEMEILAAVIELCEKHNIQYYADWGTLLGAVRHRGYIPWDDDIDIAMRRTDFNRFLEVAKELPAPFILRHSSMDDTFDDSQACVWNGRALSFEKEHLERFHGCPYILGVDIFPLDYVPRDKTAAEMQELIYQLIATTICMLRREEAQKEIENMLNQIETVCHVVIDRRRPIRTQLYKLLDTVCQMYGEDESDELTLFAMSLRNRSFRLKKEWYENTIKLPFEQMEIFAPKAYDDVLREMYGDYKQKVKFTADHGYPCYKGQEELLKKYMEE